MSSAWSWPASVWSPIARSWRAGSWRPMTAPRAGADAAGVQEDPGHRHTGAGTRAAGLATDHPAGDDPPVPVHRVWACVAPGHQPRGRAAGRAVASWTGLGAGGDRVSALEYRSRRPRAWRRGDTASDAVLAEGRRVLINDPGRLNGVKVIGVDEHVWRHTRRGDKYVTVIIDLTPVRAGTGPARLLDMIPGRSKAAFKAWLTQRPQAWREAVEVVAMDGFTGFKTAAAEEIPAAVA